MPPTKTSTAINDKKTYLIPAISSLRCTICSDLGTRVLSRRFAVNANKVLEVEPQGSENQQDEDQEDGLGEHLRIRKKSRAALAIALADFAKRAY
jgi:hypothetical protein